MSQGKRKRKGKSRAAKRPAPEPVVEETEDEPVEEEEVAAPTRRERYSERRARSLQGGDRQLPLARERTLGRLIGIASLVSVAMTFVATAFAAKASSDGPQAVSLFGSDVGDDADQAERLQDYASHDTDQLVAAVLHVGALLIAIAVGCYLYWLVRNRTPAIPRYVQWLGIAGPIAYAVTALVGYLALKDIADEFVTLPIGQQTVGRADDLKEDSGLFLVAQILNFTGPLVFAAWLWQISKEMMDVELLTRFLGIFGIGSAAAIVLSAIGITTIGEAMYIGWLGSIAILALGRWPGGRPEGWLYRVDPLSAR